MTQKKTNQTTVIEQLTKLISIINIAAIKKIIAGALKPEFKDFKDALQNFVAIKNTKIITNLSRNLKDYKTNTLAVITP